MDNEIMRSAAASNGVTFGTDAPFRMPTHVRLKSVGFADLRMAELTVWCREQDLGGLVPVVRQALYRTLEANGIPNEAVSFMPSVGVWDRGRIFADANPQSTTLGKRRKGARCEFHFEFTQAEWFTRGLNLRIV
jgi:hypothetical protein